MFSGTIPIRKAIPIIAITWIVSLITTLTVVYFALSIFTPISEEQIADGSVTSAKILDGTITALDLADGSIITIKFANGSVTTAKIADYAVNNMKLAPYAIPVNSTHKVLDDIATTSSNFVDMKDMSVTLTLDRTSHLLIMFSAEAMNDDPSHRIVVSCLIGFAPNLYYQAHPASLYLTPIVEESASHRHVLTYGSYSCHFYKPSLDPGTYTVKMQWCVSGGVGRIGFRTLTVIALPA